MDVLTFLLLALVGVFSGMIGVTVGGSALIAIPFLMMLGAGPLTAIATNKLAMISSAAMASWKYARSGLMQDWRRLVMPMILTFVFSWIGALLVLNIDERVLTLLVIGLLVLVLLVLVLLPGVGVEPQVRRAGRGQQAKSVLVFAVLGLYMGFFGPGYGTFAIFGLIYVYGLTFVSSSAVMNLLTLSGLLSSVGVFVMTASIDYALAIPLTVGVAIGGWLGAHLAVLKGNVWLKRALIGITLVLIANLFWTRVLPGL